MAKDFHMQPDAGDPVLDSPTVLAIVRRHVPAAAAVTAVDESGGEARTCSIDDDLILKVRHSVALSCSTSVVRRQYTPGCAAAVPGLTRWGQVMALTSVPVASLVSSTR